MPQSAARRGSSSSSNSDDGSEWQLTTAQDDPESNVFHKAMAYDHAGEAPKLLDCLAGTGSRAQDSGARAPTASLQSEDRLEAGLRRQIQSHARRRRSADLYGDGQALSMAVATHDQGVVAVRAARMQAADSL